MFHPCPTYVLGVNFLEVVTLWTAVGTPGETLLKFSIKYNCSLPSRDFFGKNREHCEIPLRFRRVALSNSVVLSKPMCVLFCFLARQQCTQEPRSTPCQGESAVTRAHPVDRGLGQESRDTFKHMHAKSIRRYVMTTAQKTKVVSRTTCRQIMYLQYSIR